MLKLRWGLFPVIISIFLSALSFSAAGQEADQKDPKKDQKEEKKSSKDQKNGPQDLTAEQIAEAVIHIYAFPGGRPKMLQIRKTEFERGKITLYQDGGATTNINYQRWTSRSDEGKANDRLDQELPTATYAMVRNDGKVFGIYNDSVFQPREDAIQTFQDRLANSIDALLFYKENGSSLTLAGREKVMGVEFNLIDLKHKDGKVTRFFVSVKSFRVMSLEYESAGVKYTRKFRDYKYAQGVLVPFNTELRSGNKTIEEVHVGTITFGQKIESTLFASAG